jgi:two-component system response regulator FixJ
LSIQDCRVCIIDDDEAIRESLRLLLFADGLKTCVFESADDFLQDSKCEEFACMLLDIRMPGMDGLELFQTLNQKTLSYPVIFITGHGDIPLAVSAIKQGAYDFLTKPFLEGELLEKIHAAIGYHRSLREQINERQEIKDRVSLCTPREQDVMRLLVNGLPNKGIAETLGISPRTVEIHRAHVMEKMQAESVPALVRMSTVLEAAETTD